jgi:predicted regulator of Ras-like GTPase activity (Roadblock/LC7/MglB family)
LKEIIARLRRIPGVTGVMMVSADGLLIASETSLGNRAGEEAAAAIVGNMARTVSSTLDRLDRGGVKNLTLSGAGGRAAVARAGEAYVVALLQSECNLGLIQLELGAAANEASRNISL